MENICNEVAEAKIWWSNFMLKIKTKHKYKFLVDFESINDKLY